MQLAATRSSFVGGIGDLRDLRSLAAWSRAIGAGFVAVGPLNAPNPGPRPEPSPYYPSTRRFGSPLHVADRGASGPGTLEDLQAAGRALADTTLIDRPRILALKLAP